MKLKITMAMGLAAALFAGQAYAAECSLPAEATAGKAVSNQCKSCHVFEADKPSKPTGPNIHDVFGSKAGTHADFTRYSDAMKAAQAKNLEWTEANLDEYIADPKAFMAKVNGDVLKHGMFFNLKDDAKRKDVIAFLKAIKGKPECN